MLIITGVGRCGTSLVAKFFEEMGFNLGVTHWDKNVNAGMEDQNVVWINRNLYACYQAHRSTARFLLQARRKILNFNLKVVKDPRFTWPGVLESWWRLRRDIKLLIMVRDFESVVESRKRMGTNSNDMIDRRDYTLDRLCSDFGLFTNYVLTNKIPCAFVQFPDAIDNFDILFDALRVLSFIPSCFEDGLKIWRKVADRKLVHIQRGDNEKDKDK